MGRLGLGFGFGYGVGKNSMQGTLLNQPPEFSSPNTFSVPENSTAVGTVVATEGSTYYITCDADCEKFAINETTGALTFIIAPNHDAPTDADTNNVYNIQVIALLNGVEATQTIIVTVTSLAPAVLTDGNTVGWYRHAESDTITKDGSNLVSKWEDKLNSGRDLLQASGTLQPLWSANGILFDGVNDFLQAAFTLIQPFFIYAVIKQVSWTAGEYVIGNAVGGQVIYLSQRTASPGLAIYAGTQSGVDNLTLGQYGVIRALYNGASSKLIINSNAAVTASIGTNYANGITVGATSVGTGPSNIEVKEIIVRKVADNSTDETAIYNYLKAKYGL